MKSSMSTSGILTLKVCSTTQLSEVSENSLWNQPLSLLKEERLPRLAPAAVVELASTVLARDQSFVSIRLHRQTMRTWLLNFNNDAPNFQRYA